jgi:phosphoglycolate phosphatase-like HAD superfamily hydrolase
VRDFIAELLALPQPPLLGLLTGNVQLGAEIKLRHFGLWDFFVMGGFADDHEERNHIAVAALARGRRMLDPHLQPQEVMVIGDTPHDVRCGKFIGAKTLAVATGGSTFEELQPHCADWTDLVKKGCVWPILASSRTSWALTSAEKLLTGISPAETWRPASATTGDTPFPAA